MLIRSQRPGALAVATKRHWETRGYVIAPDAVPIVILQPFGPVAFVYDINDVIGSDGFRPRDAAPFGTEGSLPPRAWEKAVAGARECGIGVELIGNFGMRLCGWATALEPPAQAVLAFDRDPVEPIRYRVRINRELAESTLFSTLAHELGHVYCGHLGGDPKERWFDRRGVLNMGQRELEAEAVAWLVCRRLGLETRSADYLSLYVTADDLKRISPYAIASAAHRIEAWRREGKRELRAVG